MSTVIPLIYVVDDDESVRRALRGLVRSAGLTVQTFPSAQEFLAFPRPDVPSCLVLDLRATTKPLSGIFRLLSK